jgi:iron complex outermembrane receptor protein
VEGLTLNVGARYTWDKIRACTGVGELQEPFVVRDETCGPNNPVFLPDTGSILNLKSDAPTWTIGLDWQATDDLFFYAASRRGYRAGGINAPKYGGTLVPFQSFSPEKVTDYEIGARTDWNIGDVSGRFNISAYIADTKNAQLGISGFSTIAGCTVGDPVFGQPPFSPDGDCIRTNDPSGTLMVANAGDKRTKGIEFDGYIIPVEGLKLSASASFLKQTTSKFAIPAAIAFYANAANGELPLYSTPKKSGTLGLSYTLPLPDSVGEVVFNSNLYWSGGVNLVTLTTKSYSLTDARLDWNNVLGSGMDAGVFVKNIFDKDQIVAGSATAPSLPIATVVYNEPRMFGLQLRYRFGN